MNYWLMKSEPSVYSIDDLEIAKQTLWDGVRNYQARNFMKQMAVGDRIFFYHSNCQPPGIVGLAEVKATEVIDPTQFDEKSDYFDPKSTLDNPRWQTVKVTFLEKFEQIVTLDQLKQMFNPEEFILVKKGNRLSVMPVPEAIALQILELIPNPLAKNHP